MSRARSGGTLSCNCSTRRAYAPERQCFGLSSNSPSGRTSMQTFAMLTRLEPDGLQSPTAVEDLEHRVMEHVRVACPTAQWIGSYAVCGPYDYLDLFRAQDLDDATKISAIVRSYGHAHTE